MDNPGIFSFKDQSNNLMIAAINLKRISLDDHSKNRIDLELIEKTVALLEEISKLKEIPDAHMIILEHLDTLSPHTRENETSRFSNDLLRFFTNDVNLDENLIGPTLKRFLYFIALLATEIPYRHNVISPNIHESPIKTIVYKMQKLSDHYSTEKNEDDEITATSKNYVKYYASRIHNQYNKKIETIAEEAKKIIPQALQENASRLSGEFNALLKRKRWAKWLAFVLLCLISSAIIAIPYENYGKWNDILVGVIDFIEQKKTPETAELDKTLTSIQNNEFEKLRGLASGFSPLFILMALVILSLEIILIYFFKVVLSNYNKIKAEITQLEIRKAICDFLPGYALFSASQEKNPSIEPFNNFIFRPLVANAEDIPKVSDGLVEAIANLLNRTNKA